MRVIIALFGMCLAVVCQGKDVFEGTYVMEMSAGKDKVQTSLQVKGGHVRMTVTSQDMPGEMIIRDGMSTMLMLMPQQKMYMEVPLQGMMGALAPEADKKPEEEKTIPFKKTGNTRKILGYEAHEFAYELGSDKMVIWATEDLGAMPFIRSPLFEGWGQAMRKVTGLSSFFPLETIGYEKGKPAYKMVIKSIEAKPLPDSLFLPPAGFRKMTMPGGMGGFLGK